MIPSVPVESRWIRPEPRRDLPEGVLKRIVGVAFPRNRVADFQPLSGGLRNSNFKVELDSAPGAVAVRIYEHDPSICRKEVELLRRVGSSVPVPEVLYAEFHGWDDVPPFALLRYIEGVTFRELKRSGELTSISQAAYSIGQTLAGVGTTGFPRAGWLGPGLRVSAPLLEGVDPMPRFVDLCLVNPHLAPRMPAELRERARLLIWSCAARLAQCEEHPRLVHGDFSPRNVLVKYAAGKWGVAAVLDWEFAISSSPLADIGHFLRYEHPSHLLAEPHFSRGYRDAGGELPGDWRRFARVFDLIALCEYLTHDALSDAGAAELVDLVRATVEGGGPHI